MFGDLLKQWRSKRRLSQLDMGLKADVSARHISFLETERAKPSREMVLRLATVLNMPFGDQNHLLAAAGFTNQYQKRNLSEAQMLPFRNAITRTMENHSPFPALLLDRHWNVVDANKVGRIMLNQLEIGLGDSLLEATVNPNGLRNLIKNWPQVHRFLLSRLRIENDYLGGDDVLIKAIEALVNIQPEFTNDDDDSALLPVLPMKFCLNGQNISLFSTIAQFGSAEDLALSEYRLELFFPFDDETERFLVELEGA
ncbi:MAG: transcriptional regulator [Hyphomicrobiales bacterium]|nr:helix-turn-helix domain-containing protein [Hyphomicrobiales bacterium]PCH51582.1 MAG: transcriptional regulator [Hyphomicrobiales bacterium]